MSHPAPAAAAAKTSQVRSQSETSVSSTEPATRASCDPWKELWRAKSKRIKANSPLKSLPGWTLKSVIYKGGDDCRQECLAMQLILLFDRIWKEASLPLRLFAYSVLITGPECGIIETIPNSISVDSLKKNVKGFVSLAQWYSDYFGEGTAEFEEAQKYFTESMAAYSLVCYFLQIKDRHNGNIMIRSDGSLVHIDFGFMFSNSPGGNFNFENCPFKLTEEYVEVMGDKYHYYTFLIIRGFLEARKHAHEFLVLVKLMFAGSNMACFSGGPAALEALEARFLLDKTDEECVQHAMALVEESYGNWRSVQYDNYQRMTNGIL